MRAIGIIAEDSSDVEVVKLIVDKYKTFDTRFEKAVGGGCGRIARKCGDWARNLASRGCFALILIRDADGNDPDKLTRDLMLALEPNSFKKSVISIPVEELESWLLSDERAIKKAIGLKKEIKKIPNPESIKDPKKKLDEIIFRATNKKARYVINLHAPKIMTACSIKSLQRCGSFSSLNDFLSELYSKGGASKQQRRTR